MRNAMKTCGLLQPKLESAGAMCMGNLDTSYTSYIYMFSQNVTLDIEDPENA